MIREMSEVEKKIVVEKGIRIAVISSETVLVEDTQAMLDLMTGLRYEENCDCLALNREAFASAFFVLSSGVAGEILQKVVNYRIKLAIFGDFSSYHSKPLQDFIRESNRGRHIFFAETEQEAVGWLAKP